MASIGTISVKLYEEPRPCIVVTTDPEEHKALFHCWGVRQYVQQAILIGEAGGQVTEMYAIVETDDGSIRYVKPRNVRFLDSAAKFNEYAFDNNQDPAYLAGYKDGYAVGKCENERTCKWVWMEEYTDTEIAHEWDYYGWGLNCGCFSGNPLEEFDDPDEKPDNGWNHCPYCGAKVIK